MSEEGFRAHPRQARKFALKMEGGEARNPGGVFKARLLAEMLRKIEKRISDSIKIRGDAGVALLRGGRHEQTLRPACLAFDPILAVSVGGGGASFAERAAQRVCEF